MIDIDQVIKEVSVKTGADRSTVDSVCKHVFQSIIYTMKDETDTKDILLNNLFKFKLKNRYKLNKQQKYSSK